MRLGMLSTGLALGALMLGQAYAESVVQRQLTYVYMADDGSDAPCAEFLRLTIENKTTGFARTRDICGGGRVTPVISDGDDKVVVIDKKGGNAAGWGLYRYNITKDVLELHDFNAREIYIGQRGHDGVDLTVMYADYDTQKGEYRPDKVSRWTWRFDNPHPVRQ